MYSSSFLNTLIFRNSWLHYSNRSLCKIEVSWHADGGPAREHKGCDRLSKGIAIDTKSVLEAIVALRDLSLHNIAHAEEAEVMLFPNCRFPLKLQQKEISDQGICFHAMWSTYFVSGITVNETNIPVVPKRSFSETDLIEKVVFRPSRENIRVTGLAGF